VSLENVLNSQNLLKKATLKKYQIQKLSQFNAEMCWYCICKILIMFCQIFIRVETIHQKCTTTCKIHIRQNTILWVTPDIVQLLKKKATSLKAYRSLKTPEAKLIFTQFSNKWILNYSKQNSYILKIKLIERFPTQEHLKQLNL